MRVLSRESSANTWPNGWKKCRQEPFSGSVAPRIEVYPGSQLGRGTPCNITYESSSLLDM